jgi:hypothetical protein
LGADLYILKIDNTTMNITYSSVNEGVALSLDYANETLHYTADGTIVAVIDAADASIVRSTDNG